MTAPLHTAHEVAVLLNKTVRTIQTNCRNGWDHTKIGRSYYFTPEQLTALIQKGRTTPTPTSGRRAQHKALRNQLKGIQ